MKRFSRVKLLALTVSFALSSLPGGTSLAAEARSGPVLASLQSSTDQQTNRGTRNGYILMDAASGETLAQHNADALFIPASLAKIPTTLMTLNAFGLQRRFDTRLIADGTVIDGVLQGDLHLVGSGDPSLKKSDIKGLAAKLNAAGIREITGKFTYDPSALPQSAVIDEAQPAGTHYNPPIGGLNVDSNLKSGRPGYRAARMMRYFAHQNEGITLPEPERSAQQSFGVEIATHKSAPVSQLIASMMENSNNLAAESLGAMSVASSGQVPKSLAEAALTTSQWIKTEIGEIDSTGWNGFRMANHSGLSTRSRATPRQIAAILRLGYLRFGRTFTDMHSKNQPGGFQAYKLRGKFGTMKFVRGYGGFLTVSGREMIFAIMSDDRDQRARADTGEAGLRSAAWMHKARGLEQSILSEWIVDFWQARTPEPVLVADEAFVDPLENVVATSPVITQAITFNDLPSPNTVRRTTMEPIRSEGDPIAVTTEAEVVDFIDPISTVTPPMVVAVAGDVATIVRTTSLVE